MFCPTPGRKLSLRLSDSSQPETTFLSWTTSDHSVSSLKVWEDISVFNYSSSHDPSWQCVSRLLAIPCFLQLLWNIILLYSLHPSPDWCLCTLESFVTSLQTIKDAWPDKLTLLGNHMVFSQHGFIVTVMIQPTKPVQAYCASKCLFLFSFPRIEQRKL